VTRSATTIRINEEQLRQIRAIAGYENKSLADIFSEMAEEYISRHRETLSLLGIPGFVKECREGLEEIKAGGGKDLIALDD
jgi:predicted CopG family antitoxin